jgi:Xaa-Pro dipeptidase
MYFPREEYEQRWAHLHDEMAARQFDTAVVWQRSGGSYDRAGNVWYLSNYAAQNNGQEPTTPFFGVGQAYAALLVRRGYEPELHLLQQQSGIEGIDRRYVAVEHIQGHPGSIGTGVAERLRELGVEGRVAYVGDDFLPLEIWRDLERSTPTIEWIAQDDLLYSIQHVKSPRELDLFREAGEISSAALTAFMEGLIRGEPQCEAASRAAAIITAAGGGFQRLGCNTGPTGDTCFFDYPLYGYSKEAAKPGEMVHAWVIPVIEGYWLDPGRTSVCGARPTHAQRRLVEGTVDVCEEVIRSYRPGVTPREVGVLADNMARRLGLTIPEAGGHLYGHGMSTFWSGPVVPGEQVGHVEDDPFWNIDEPFYNGQLFTAEAFFEEPGVGLAGIEEIVIIWEDGVERLTNSPKTFW